MANYSPSSKAEPTSEGQVCLFAFGEWRECLFSHGNTHTGYRLKKGGRRGKGSPVEFKGIVKVIWIAESWLKLELVDILLF